MPEAKSFEEFYKMVERLHHIKDIELLISYIDPHDNDLLPINNDDNFVRALSTAKPLLRLIIQRKGECGCDPICLCLFSTMSTNGKQFFLCAQL